MARDFETNSQTTHYNLMLGVFLKLLAFFIILYIYADIDPVKLSKAETSVKEQFNVSVSLSLNTGGPTAQTERRVAETAGYSLQNIDTAMRAQFDMLSTRFDRANDTMILRIPARIALAYDNRLPNSPAFAEIFTHTLGTQRNERYSYQVELIAAGGESRSMMRAISVLARQMQCHDYPGDLLTIGYADEDVTSPVLEIRIKPVPHDNERTGA